ncbi:MAG: hypothetical protein H6557_24840 [Lewinellaceae bacterium]|nr:hypothetical protein [Phaeodactylibacter sp.]MCB9039860.1 hypothetical protein [Lewinellaceae bacterium]
MKIQVKFIQITWLFIVIFFSSCDFIQGLFGSSTGTGTHVTQNPIESFEYLPEECGFNSEDNFEWLSGTSGLNIKNALNDKLQNNNCNLNATSPCIPPPAPPNYSGPNSMNYSTEIKCEGDFDPCKLWYSSNSGTISLSGDDMNTILNNAFANAHSEDRPYCTCQSMKAHIKSQVINAQNVNGNRSIYVTTTYECCGLCK